MHTIRRSTWGTLSGGLHGAHYQAVYMGHTIRRSTWGTLSGGLHGAHYQAVYMGHTIRRSIWGTLSGGLHGAQKNRYISGLIDLVLFYGSTILCLYSSASTDKVAYEGIVDSFNHLVTVLSETPIISANLRCVKSIIIKRALNSFICMRWIFIT
jgi:hypothetical protein